MIPVEIVDMLNAKRGLTLFEAPLHGSNFDEIPSSFIFQWNSQSCQFSGRYRLLGEKRAKKMDKLPQEVLVQVFFFSVLYLLCVKFLAL